MTNYESFESVIQQQTYLQGLTARRQPHHFFPFSHDVTETLSVWGSCRNRVRKKVITRTTAK